jgi:hypothetical protein
MEMSVLLAQFVVTIVDAIQKQLFVPQAKLETESVLVLHNTNMKNARATEVAGRL